MELKFHSVDAFKIPLGTYLTSRGLDISEVDDVIVLVKNNPTDEDVDAIASLSIGSGVTVDVGNNTITFNFAYGDFGSTSDKLQADRSYKVGVGIKTPATAKYLEPNLSDNTLKILKDFIHD